MNLQSILMRAAKLTVGVAVGLYIYNKFLVRGMKAMSPASAPADTASSAPIEE